MVFDTEVGRLLDVLNSSFPAVQTMSGAQARAEIAARRAPVDNLDDVRETRDTEIPTSTGHIDARLYFPHGQPANGAPVVVFFHGGGFVFCDIESHDGFCREMARNTDSIVVSVAYRLAPEHKAPAAAYDAFDSLRWVADNAAALGADPARIVVAGDSAGGNLAAVACLMSKEHGAPDIAAQVLLYPVIDPTCDTDSYHRYATGHYNTTAAMRWYWRQYLPDGAVPSPQQHVAPMRAPSLARLPPAVIVTAHCDPVRDDGARYAAALSAADVEVVHRDYPGLFHGFLTIAQLRAARSARSLLWHDMRRLNPSPRAELHTEGVNP